jgi:presenilin-like A22 family membrane protease
VSQESKTSRYIFILQVVSISLIWIFVSSITWWIIRLISVSLKLHDAPDASVGISIIVIPVFITLASVLTYVFVGLQRHRGDNKIRGESEDKK